MEEIGFVLHPTHWRVAGECVECGRTRLNFRLDFDEAYHPNMLRSICVFGSFFFFFFFFLLCLVTGHTSTFWGRSRWTPFRKAVLLLVATTTITNNTLTSKLYSFVCKTLSGAAGGELSGGLTSCRIELSRQL